MPAQSPLGSSETDDLRNRLALLEKFIELKSNECAYYRSKVHLMQMSSSVGHKPDCSKRSSSEEISQSSIVSAKPSISSMHRYRTGSMPSSAPKRAIKHHPRPSPLDRSKPTVAKHRKVRKLSAQNQNHYEENAPNEHTGMPFDQMLSSCIQQHLQQALAQNKTAPCREQKLCFAQTPLPSTPTALVIRLPSRFVKALTAQQKRSSTSEVKVQLSAELLHKLLESVSGRSDGAKKPRARSDTFTIQSQFGALRAHIDRSDAGSNSQDEWRKPAVRHVARARTDAVDRRSAVRKLRQQREKKRPTRKSSVTSREELFSKRSSSHDLTQSVRTATSSN